MRIIRPIAPEDFDQYQNLAFTSVIGITSLPKNPDLLRARMQQSFEAFDEKKPHPHQYRYVFVLENLENGEIEGTCGINSKTGVSAPTAFYRLEMIPHPSSVKEVPNEIKVLRPITYSKGPSELCGLYLLPERRHSSFGKLLSFSRFLFIASYKKRFSKKIFALMRGFLDEHNQSVFWNQVGSHFVNLSFEEILERYVHSKKIVKDILPKYPIYYDLLPLEVQECLGKTHKHTVPALKLLEKNGFHITDEIDIFDGGPKLLSQTNEIKFVKDSRIKKVGEIVETLDCGGEWLISNTSLNFRATIGELHILNQQAVIDRQTAEALRLKVGDEIRYIAI